MVSTYFKVDTIVINAGGLKVYSPAAYDPSHMHFRRRWEFMYPD
ncbi:hypothetical protein APX70_02957 [Pseudomonas syringae pv. maculicola]|uniref:Uncharacterized protein n=1 Tax=Pseudomonas syringae pv. maculicola TaxID=59511 RepID=A0A3M2VQ08_PSEYM|nr:hypothetical protein APX70_02957 [Pseudomonas syringae pv. maculicola]